MKDTMKVNVELEQVEGGVCVDVKMEGKCSPEIAEKVIYCILEGFHTNAPISTLLAIDRFLNKYLGVKE